MIEKKVILPVRKKSCLHAKIFMPKKTFSLSVTNINDNINDEYDDNNSSRV